MSRRARRVVVAVLAATAMVGSGACGGGSAGTGPAESSPPTAAATTTTTLEPAGEPVPSSGCTDPTAPAIDQGRQTVSVAGADRWWSLTAPADGAEPVPLLLDFHGLMEGAQVHTEMTRYPDLAASEGFAVAIPNGSGDPLRWNVGVGDTTDLDFVAALLDTVGAERCIDTSRVYATGLSYGGLMSSFLACTMSDRIAAIAPIDGFRPPDQCEPERPVPVMTVHGTADPILPFNGGVGDIGGIIAAGQSGAAPSTTIVPYDLEGEGYPAAVRQWASRNDCDPQAVDTEVSDEVIRRAYACPAGAEVEFYIVVGGGHSWPGSEFSRSIGEIVGPTTFDIDATELGWEFLRSHRLPAT